MPFYLVCDVSFSMRFELAALHKGITEVCEAIGNQPLLNDLVWVSVVTFADSAEAVMRLTEARQCQVPWFTHENSAARWGAAFRVLAEEMREDYGMLRDLDRQVFPPCAYFLTGGDPIDHDWDQTFDDTLTKRALAEFDMHVEPILVPFGFQNVQESTLRRLAYPRGRSRWYHSRDTSVDDSLRRLLRIITDSILSSGKSGAWGAPGHDLPHPGPGSGVSSGFAE
jgi:uncharacterized protein YegL